MATINKLFRKLEDYWGIYDNPIVVIKFSLISVIAGLIFSGFIFSTFSAFAKEKNNPRYETAFGDSHVSSVLVQTVDNKLQIVDIESREIDDLNVSVDYLVSSYEPNHYYGVSVTSEGVLVHEILNNSDKYVIINNWSAPLSANFSDTLEIKANKECLFILNQTSNTLSVIDLEEKTTVYEMELDLPAMDWQVDDARFYLLSDEDVKGYDIQTQEPVFNVYSADVEQINLNNNVITLASMGEDSTYLVHYEAETGGIIEADLFDVPQSIMLDGNTNESYLNISFINNQGGVTLQMKDLNTGVFYDNPFNLKNVKDKLNFSSGYAFYVNQDNKGEILAPDGKEIILETMVEIKNILPFE